MSTPLSFKLRTYCLASLVSGGGAGGGCFEARSRYKNPAAPATSTTAITIATGGIETGFGCDTRALSSANRHLSDLQRRRRHRSAKFQVAPDRLDPPQHLLQLP